MAKIVIIDEKGKLFGLINLLDLIVLIALLVLLFLGSSAYLALKTSDPQIVNFSPKRINNEKANNVTLVLKNDRRIGSAKVTMIPHRFAGERIQPRTSVVKAKRNEITVSIPAGVPSGNYLFELELVVLDALNRQSTNVLNFTQPLVIEQKKEVVQKASDLYPWSIEVDVLFPGDSAILQQQLKVEDTMADGHGRLIAEVLAIRPSRSSDTLNLAGKPWRKEEIPYKGGLTARLRLQPEILQNQLAFQGKAISAGQQIKFNIESTSLAGYVTGKGDLKYQKVTKGWEVLAEVLMLGVNQGNAGIIRPKYTQTDGSGVVWAEIIEVTEEESQIKESYRNVAVQMFLDCSIRQGRLCCQNVLIEPGAFLNFPLKNQTVTGIVKRIFYIISGSYNFIYLIKEIIHNNFIYFE